MESPTSSCSASCSIRAIVFDLDGTLIDSLSDIANAANAVLESLSLPIHPSDSYRTFVGEGVAVLFSRALPASVKDESLIEQCVERMRDEYERRWHCDTRPYPGVLEVLQELRTRGIRLAVLSNKPQLFSRKCVEHFFPAGTFDLVLGQRAGVPRKPDPAGAHEIAASLELDSAQCALVGDSSIDMETALRAGMVPLGVAWGFRSQAELESSGALRVLTHPRELLDWVE